MQSKEDQIQVIGNLKNISMASSKLLLAAKSLSVDPSAANAKNLLAVAARCDKIEIIPDLYLIISSFVFDKYHTVCAELNHVILNVKPGAYLSLQQIFRWYA